MHIVTDRGVAKFDGEHVTMLLPSGSETLEIRLTTHQTQALACMLALVAKEAFDEQDRRNRTTTAEIIAFPQQVPSLARRERNLANRERALRVDRLELRREGRISK